MINITTQYISGTASEIVQSKVKISGKEVDAVGLSVMAKYGVIEVQGVSNKEPNKRGRAGVIYKIDRNKIHATV